METEIKALETEKFLILSISGGIGKNIAATTLAKALKEKYPDYSLIVLTAWKEVWMYNPYVYRSYTFNNAPYFYSNYIEKKEVKIFSLEPYQTEGYILKREHLLQSWFQLCGLEYSGEMPELFFNQREIEYVVNNISKNDPILLIQTHGGGEADIKHSWMRDLPIEIAQEVVNNFIGKCRIIHVRRQDQLPLQNVETFSGSLRELFVLIRQSKYRLFIDSMCQHAAAALGKKSTVAWIRNSPHVLGYEIHDNYVTDAQDEIDSLDWSVFEPYVINGVIAQCPFKEGTKLFDTQELVKSILNVSED
jgi:hypothetical protein